MRQSKVKVINKVFGQLGDDFSLTPAQVKNARRNIKKIITRDNITSMAEINASVDIARVIARSRIYARRVA